MIIKDIEVRNDLLEDKYIRLMIKLFTHPTWKWCKKYGNWYLYNPRHFYETDKDLLPIKTNKLVDIPYCSDSRDSRFMFVNCNKFTSIRKYEGRE